jgi:hypothetical protein
MISQLRPESDNDRLAGFATTGVSSTEIVIGSILQIRSVSEVQKMNQSNPDSRRDSSPCYRGIALTVTAVVIWDVIIAFLGTTGSKDLLPYASAMIICARASQHDVRHVVLLVCYESCRTLLGCIKLIFEGTRFSRSITSLLIAGLARSFKVLVRSVHGAQICL